MTQALVPTPLPPPAQCPPDWAAVREEVRCPLCEYDLRGLAEPRCPECGYAFEWSDLSDPAKKRHPFLFEHHPERNVRSFIQTVGAGYRPRRFWQTLYPTQPSRPWRLTAYAVCVVLVALLAPAFRLAHGFAWSTMGLPSVAFPWSTSWAASSWGQALAGAWRFSGAADMTEILAFFLLWAGTTWGALLLFRVSMQRSRIRPVHVARCVVYSFDALFWAGAVAALCAAAAAVLDLYSVNNVAMSVALNLAPYVFFLLIFAVPWRLWRAYRHYLRFEHPLLTVLASQVIAYLVIINVASMIATWDVTA